MYAELEENKNGPSTIETPKNIEKNSDNPATKGKKSIQNNSDLRKGLMDEESSHDLDVYREDKTSLMDEDDPYYVFKEDLLIKLDLVEDGLERYERIVKNTDTAVNTHEVKDAKKQLKRHIKNAESTLKDLQTTVKMVEKKRDKFDNIDDSELYDRKNFIVSCTKQVQTVKEGMNSQGIKTKLLADERAKSKRRLGLATSSNQDDHEDTSFITQNHASAQLMMQQQDETLDELDGAVVRVGHMAGHINEELGHQKKMLNELEEDLDNVEEQLGLVMGKLAKLLKTKSKCQLGTILILSLIVIVLFFLVVS